MKIFIDDRLKNALFIVKQNTYLSITLLGKEMYLREKSQREQKINREDKLYNAQIDNIKATKTALKYNKWTFWAIVIYTAATVLSLIMPLLKCNK